METIGSIGYPFIRQAAPAVAPSDRDRQRKGDRNNFNGGDRGDDAPGSADMPGADAAGEQSAASPRHKLNLTV
jgi:hypothetical protein